MSRYFNFHEAEQLLPALRNLLETAIRSKKKAESADGQLAALNQRIILEGGVLVDIEQAWSLKSQKDTSAGELREVLAQIEASGCLIKDLDSGLIDFPCLVKDREIYLCWKLGEPNIRFWHHVDEGFKCRKPLEPDMLKDGGPGSRPN